MWSMLSWTFTRGPVEALAGVAQWVEHWSVNQRVAGSIPSHGTCLGCRAGPWLRACERQPIYVSLTR